MTTTNPAALATALRAAQQAANTARWQDAARHLAHAADLATALATDAQSAPAPRTPAPAPAPRAAQPAAAPDADATAVADHLRSLAKVDDGAAYLDGLGLDAARLRAVAAALGLTRVDRLGAGALRGRVLKQAIGARNKFAGLRSW